MPSLRIAILMLMNQHTRARSWHISTSNGEISPTFSGGVGVQHAQHFPWLISIGVTFLNVFDRQVRHLVSSLRMQRLEL